MLAHMHYSATLTRKNEALKLKNEMVETKQENNYTTLKTEADNKPNGGPGFRSCFGGGDMRGRPLAAVLG